MKVIKKIGLAGSISILLLGMLGCSNQDINSGQTSAQTIHSSSSSATASRELTVASSLPKVSVQLWSVKNGVSSDFKGTLQQLAKMGFQGVEFAGEFGEFANDPAGLKQFLNSLGLQVSGAHIHFDKLHADKFAQTVEFYRAIGTT